MALDQSALLELLDLLRAGDADDVVRRAVESVFSGVDRGRGDRRHRRLAASAHRGRVARCNSHRDRLVTTAAGDVELRIPKLRSGSFFPSLLERRRRIDQALFAVVMEAYVTGTSTRKGR